MNVDATQNNRCPCCERDMPDVERRRRNTAYVDDELNYLVSCGECHARDLEYYQELWDDYWRGRL